MRRRWNSVEPAGRQPLPPDAGEFDSDRSAVIARAQAAGVRLQVPAVTAASWPKLRVVCQQAPGLHPAYGLHPMFLAEHRPDHLPLLREWIERERPCAIGECGLDFFVEGWMMRRNRRISSVSCNWPAVRAAGNRARATRGGRGDRCDPPYRRCAACTAFPAAPNRLRSCTGRASCSVSVVR